MASDSTSTIEIELPQATKEAIEAFAVANAPMTFNEATQRFISLGMNIEALAMQKGVVIICAMPDVRVKK